MMQAQVTGNAAENSAAIDHGGFNDQSNARGLIHVHYVTAFYRHDK
jgi:hypothetical protein